MRKVYYLELEQFKIYCKKNKKNTSEQLKKYIRESGRFEAVLETELRMKAMVDDVIAHLDLNTQAYLLNVQKGLIPLVEEQTKE